MNDVLSLVCNNVHTFSPPSRRAGICARIFLYVRSLRGRIEALTVNLTRALTRITNGMYCECLGLILVKEKLQILPDKTKYPQGKELLD